MKKKYLITCALPYANGPLHFGHIAGAYLPGDCYARFQRLMQQQVLFVCGSDEYGIAITLSAELSGCTPQEHVDRYHALNYQLFKKLNLSFDHYSRTTWKGHVKPVQQFFLDLLNNGYIEEKVTQQLYSEGEKRFLADRYVVGECPQCGYAEARGDECPQCGASYEALDLKNPRSKLTQSPLTLKATNHWFLQLDKFKERLSAWIETKSWKPNVINFIKGYIKDLRPRAITRDSTWGIEVPLPNTQGKVLYVWFDAPIGYISATMEWAEQKGTPEKWKEYWFDSDTSLVHFLGKDNIPFHAAIFPAMIMGQNQPYIMVDQMPANEFFKLEGRQFSKSDGWYIDLDHFFAHYTVDQIRYYIAANAPETADSEFTWKDFQNRSNSELLGKYGNLVNRVLVFAHNNCGGAVPALRDLEEGDLEFLALLRTLVDQAKENYQMFKLRAAVQTLMELAQVGNVYFDNKRPWQDAKQEEGRPRMLRTIACCLECLKVLALVSYPIIPDTAEKVWQFLGYSERLEDHSWQSIAASPIATNQRLNKPGILFQRIEDEQIKQEIEKLQQMTAEDKKPEQEQVRSLRPLKPLIDINDVDKLDLRVAVILAAESLPKSKKLLRLKVDLGSEQRTIVSGISQHYTPDQLVGKKVIVIANLKPATLMGVESQGMVLAGSLDAQLELPTLEKLPAGSIVT